MCEYDAYRHDHTVTFALVTESGKRIEVLSHKIAYSGMRLCYLRQLKTAKRVLPLVPCFE